MINKNWLIVFLGILILVTALAINSASGKARKGDTVTINYTLTLDDGTVYDSTIGREPLTTTLGQGLFIVSFEEQLIGMRLGESKTFTLPPEEAFGFHRSDLIGTVERSWLPESVEPQVGKQVQTEFKDGTPTIATIIEFTETTITLDANHPLAGKTLNFDIELLGIVSNAAPTGPNQMMLGWVILVFAAAVASFLLFKTRNLQSASTAKRRVGARSNHF